MCTYSSKSYQMWTNCIKTLNKVEVAIIIYDKEF